MALSQRLLRENCGFEGSSREVDVGAKFTAPSAHFKIDNQRAETELPTPPTSTDNTIS